MTTKYKVFLSLALVSTAFLAPLEAKTHYQLSNTNAVKNNIPPRSQWNGNLGYCGEVSLISAGLYYGQYMSQYDVRALALQNGPQTSGQLLLGQTDLSTAQQMHLRAEEWDFEQEENVDQFLSWVKENVVKGYPVAIGIFTNEYLFYSITNPNAGDDEYDHIVPVIGFESNHALTDSTYYGDDVIIFSDNGLFGSSKNPPYVFSYTCDSFQATRKQANAKKGNIYSLYNSGNNYGISISGVMDTNGDTLPVRIDTNVCYERPPIVDGSNTRPTAKPLILTVTVSNLQPGVLYNLYKYTSLDAVPNEEFNASADKASESWQISITSGSTYVMTETIQSNEVAIYRAVKASAP